MLSHRISRAGFAPTTGSAVSVSSTTGNDHGVVPESGSGGAVHHFVGADVDTVIAVAQRGKYYCWGVDSTCFARICWGWSYAWSIAT